MMPRPREEQECRLCKNRCVGKFADDEDKDCSNFVPRRISAEENFLRKWITERRQGDAGIEGISYDNVFALNDFREVKEGNS